MANEESSSRTPISAGFIGIAVVAALLIIFIFQNTGETGVKFLFWDVRAPMWLVLLGTAVVTLVLAEVATFLRKRRRR